VFCATDAPKVGVMRNFLHSLRKELQNPKSHAIEYVEEQSELPAVQFTFLGTILFSLIHQQTLYHYLVWQKKQQIPINNLLKVQMKIM
jgi:hypothetical protein